MSTIDKMLIKGIRSFSPDNTSVIGFFKPLTLIVGPNGAGKTTIIECLKHACTGELPPNARSGHSFINDPKVAGETETKGQIKLRFRTAAGKDVVCIRSFQLTQKASKLEYKAIESVLQTINAQTGEKVCLSYRCADMDREVPTLMGVSKAVLENVIFVHQDEANWPLAEAAVLKRKFDDIFSATRYTKALEVIKKLHKDQAQLLKEYKLKLDHLQTLRDAAYRLKENVEVDKQKSDHLQAHIKELEDKIKAAQTRIEDVEGLLKRMQSLQDDVQKKEAARSVLVRQKVQQYNELEEASDDTLEELEEWQAKFGETVGTMRLNISKMERETSDIRAQLDNDKAAYMRNLTSKGRLQSEADTHAENRRDRDSCLQSILQKHGIGNTGPLPLSDDAASTFYKQSVQKMEQLKHIFAQLKEGNRAEEQKLTSKMEVVQSKYLESQQQVKSNFSQKTRLQGRSQELERLVEESTLSEGDVKRIDEKERSTKAEADMIATKIREKNFDDVIDMGRSELFSLENRIKALQREKDGLTEESSDRVRLKSKKEELQGKDSTLQKLYEDHSGSFEKILKNKALAAKDVTRELERQILMRKTARTDADSATKEAGNEVAVLSRKSEDIRAELQQKEQERDAKRQLLVTRMTSVVDKALDLDRFQDQMEKAAEDQDAQARVESMADGLARCLGGFERIARDTHSCPACHRPFTPEEEDTFVSQQRSASVTSREKLQEIKRVKDKADIRFKQLDALKPIYEEYKKLQGLVIPALKETARQLQEQLRIATERHDDRLGELAQVSTEVEEAEKLKTPADRIEVLHKEVEVMRRQVEEMEFRLETASQGLRSVEDVNTDIANLEEKRDEASRRVEKLREEQQHLKDDWTAWNLRWRNAREEKIRIASELQKVNEMRVELKRVVEEVDLLEASSQALTRELEPLKKEQEELAMGRAKFRERAQAEENQLDDELRVIVRDIDQLRTVNAKVENYVAAGKEDRLKEITENLAQSQAQQQALEARLATKLEELGSNQDLLREQASVKRNIDDNINYRKTVMEEEKLAAQIEATQVQIVNIGDPNALESELKSLLQEKQGWLADQNRSKGTLLAYEGNIAKDQSDLRAPQYKDIDRKYRTQLIQLKTTEMANRDLDKYYKALDRALMRFHTLKMEEINKIIKELWQQTYRGQDIDYIEIRSDAEGQGTRSYAYRAAALLANTDSALLVPPFGMHKVVMKSGDAELDMRGRCSAGQKVLASLIIRLALAETFCLNCGILALDEPTTNLDGPNADSLAAALLRIMEDRKGQENFQLIVITHDEHFAQMIGQRQHAEQYYRIAKDDHQNSRIVIQEIFE
eukprot:SM000172S03083  [mRNA]  locus=s172:238718:247159:+ [translate_table: standard]